MLSDKETLIISLKDDLNTLIENQISKVKDELELRYQTELNDQKTLINSLVTDNQKLKEHIKQLNLRKPKENLQEEIKKLHTKNNEIEQSLKETRNKVGTLNSNNNISEKFKSIEKDFNEHETKLNEYLCQNKSIETSVNEVWKLIENTNDNGNEWFTVGKKGKIVQPVKEKRKFELVIFGDSITKRIIPNNIVKCDENKALNYSQGGARVKGIYDQIRQYKSENPDADANNILVHVGSNHIPRESPESTAKKICKLLLYIREEMPKALIFFSGILPKIGSEYFGAIDFINRAVCDVCVPFRGMYFICHGLFGMNGHMNSSLFWEDNVHTNREGLRQLAYDFINAIRYKSSVSF